MFYRIFGQKSEMTFIDMTCFISRYLPYIQVPTTQMVKYYRAPMETFDLCTSFQEIDTSVKAPT